MKIDQSENLPNTSEDLPAQSFQKVNDEMLSKSESEVHEADNDQLKKSSNTSEDLSTQSFQQVNDEMLSKSESEVHEADNDQSDNNSSPKPTPKRSIPSWRIFLRSVSTVLWIFLALVILANIGRACSVLPANAQVPTNSMETQQVVQPKLTNEQLELGLTNSQSEAESKALQLANDELDIWVGELMTHVDEDFLDWYFGYWNQQFLGIKGLGSSISHFLKFNSLTAAEAITRDTQKEFSKRVLKPVIAQQRLAKITRDVTRCYIRELFSNLRRNIKLKYNLSNQNWDLIQQDINMIVRGVDGKSVSLPMKAFVTASAPGGLMVGKFALLGIKKIAAKVPAKFASKVVAKMAAKTSGEVVGIGIELLGPLTTIAILAWDVWDIHNTGEEAKPMLRHDLKDYFDGLKDAFLNDPDYGIASVFGQTRLQYISSAL